jgi:hypothetical protein
VDRLDVAVRGHVFCRHDVVNFLVEVNRLNTGRLRPPQS